MSHPFNLESFKLVCLVSVCFSSPHGYGKTTKRDETALKKDKTWQHLEIGNAPPDASKFSVNSGAEIQGQRNGKHWPRGVAHTWKRKLTDIYTHKHSSSLRGPIIHIFTRPTRMPYDPAPDLPSARQRYRTLSYTDPTGHAVILTKGLQSFVAWNNIAKLKSQDKHSRQMNRTAFFITSG